MTLPAIRSLKLISSWNLADNPACLSIFKMLLHQAARQPITTPANLMALSAIVISITPPKSLKLPMPYANARLVSRTSGNPKTCEFPFCYCIEWDLSIVTDNVGSNTVIFSSGSFAFQSTMSGWDETTMSDSEPTLRRLQFQPLSFVQFKADERSLLASNSPS